MIRQLAYFTVGLILWLIGSAAAFADGPRVALVVGVGAYRHVPQLPNPPRDARAIAETLRRLGFEADLVVDPDRAALERAIRNLGARSRSADAALFFYAGHALEVAGRNVLIPVTAQIESAQDVPFETVDLDLLINQLAGARTTLIFLDACRDNPFLLRLGGDQRGFSPRGLAIPTTTATGTLVAFATAPGQTAADGAGSHSPFTAALLRYLETPGLELRQMLSRVRHDVRAATGNAQTPWESSALEGDFYFNPARAAAPPAPHPRHPRRRRLRRRNRRPDPVSRRSHWLSPQSPRSRRPQPVPPIPRFATFRGNRAWPNPAGWPQCGSPATAVAATSRSTAIR